MIERGESLKLRLVLCIFLIFECEYILFKIGKMVIDNLEYNDIYFFVRGVLVSIYMFVDYWKICIFDFLSINV